MSPADPGVMIGGTPPVGTFLRRTDKLQYALGALLTVFGDVPGSQLAAKKVCFGKRGESFFAQAQAPHLPVLGRNVADRIVVQDNPAVVGYAPPTLLAWYNQPSRPQGARRCQNGRMRSVQSS